MRWAPIIGSNSDLRDPSGHGPNRSLLRKHSVADMLWNPMGLHCFLGQSIGQVVATAVQGGEEGAIAEVPAADVRCVGVRT